MVQRSKLANHNYLINLRVKPYNVVEAFCSGTRETLPGPSGSIRRFKHGCKDHLEVLLLAVLRFTGSSKVFLLLCHHGNAKRKVQLALFDEIFRIS